MLTLSSGKAAKTSISAYTPGETRLADFFHKLPLLGLPNSAHAQDETRHDLIAVGSFACARGDWLRYKQD